MAPNFLALATTLENLGARWLLAKKVNFVPCNRLFFSSNNIRLYSKPFNHDGNWHRVPFYWLVHINTCDLHDKRCHRYLFVSINRPNSID